MVEANVRYRKITPAIRGVVYFFVNHYRGEKPNRLVGYSATKIIIMTMLILFWNIRIIYLPDKCFIMAKVDAYEIITVIYNGNVILIKYAELIRYHWQFWRFVL